MTAQAAPNDAFPGVVEVDAGREPLIIRVMRVGQRHDRVIFTVSDVLITAALQNEGDDIGVVRRVLGVIEMSA